MLFTKTTLIFVALWTCLIAHKSVCSRIILNMKTFKFFRWSIKFLKKSPFELKERFTCVSRVPWMYGATLTNDGSIISSSWERLARLSHHLGKGRLIEWTAQPLKPPLQILPLCLSWFCLIPPTQKPFFSLSHQHHPRDLFHGGPCYSATQAVLSYQSVSLMQTHTHLERNCDEHPSLYKMTFFNESFILLTMALIQKWMQLFKNGH